MASTPGVGPVVKSLPANVGGGKGHRFNPWVGRTPWRRARQPSRYSCLENPVDRGAWRAVVMGSHRIWPDCRDSARERSSSPLLATALLRGCEPPTLCDPVDCGLPDSPAHGVFQGRILEWLSFPSPGNLPDPEIEPASSACTCLGRRALYHCAAAEVPVCTDAAWKTASLWGL